jgi:hypothetical protein
MTRVTFSRSPHGKYDLGFAEEAGADLFVYGEVWAAEDVIWDAGGIRGDKWQGFGAQGG